MKKALFVFTFCSLLFCSNSLGAQVVQKYRLIVLSDIESEVDDTESFIRLLLYSNEIDLKGLVATT